MILKVYSNWWSFSRGCLNYSRCLVKLKDERVLVAEMRFYGDEVTLIKYNKEDIKVARKNIVFCHKIVWVKEI